MNSTTQKKAQRSIAASAAVLVGTGLAVSTVPAQAAAPAEQASVLGATSPHSLMSDTAARYGETSRLWNGAEAAAFAKIA